MRVQRVVRLGHGAGSYLPALGDSMARGTRKRPRAAIDFQAPPPAIDGSTPSRDSRKAPPPVEIYTDIFDAVSTAARCRRHRRWRTRAKAAIAYSPPLRCRGRTHRTQNTPTGPFQTTVPALSMARHIGLRGLRADVGDHVVRADLVDALDGGRRVGGERRQRLTSVGSGMSAPAPWHRP